MAATRKRTSLTIQPLGSGNVRFANNAGVVMSVTCVHVARMRWTGVIAVLALLVAGGPLAGADAQGPAPLVGEQHEITRSYENSQQGSDGSTGSSSGSDTISERVIAVTGSGIELEYDLWLGATAEDRARRWMFPARVLRQADGVMRLLNPAELAARLERWLTAAKWTREVCGRWIFTWNAFLIECDPEAVVKSIEGFDLFSVDLREGARYEDPDARGPGTLRHVADGPEGRQYSVMMEVDPEAIRRERARTDVALGEIMQTPVTLDAALLARARERTTGTIEVTINTDPSGKPRRQTRVTKLKIIEADGKTQTETRTVIIERRPVSGGTILQ
jgi:hypothetical protein